MEHGYRNVPATTRHELGWEGTHRYGLAFWPEISPKDLLVIGGCIVVAKVAHAYMQRKAPAGVWQQKWHMHACMHAKKDSRWSQAAKVGGHSLPCSKYILPI